MWRLSSFFFSKIRVNGIGYNQRRWISIKEKRRKKLMACFKKLKTSPYLREKPEEELSKVSKIMLAVHKQPWLGITKKVNQQQSNVKNESSTTHDKPPARVNESLPKESINPKLMDYINSHELGKRRKPRVSKKKKNEQKTKTIPSVGDALFSLPMKRGVMAQSEKDFPKEDRAEIAFIGFLFFFFFLLLLVS